MVEISPASVLDLFRPGERKRREAFRELRRRVHEQVEQETQERIKKKPVPTDAELRLGCFVEMLEPQVRDAVFKFNRKGYTTHNSGFWGDNCNLQIIDGVFILDPETRKRLEAIGATVKDVMFWGKAGTAITYRPKNPDINHIKQQWDTIAEMLPDKGHPAAPSENLGADNFRDTYGKRS
jgi:hypothetical protein